MGVSEKFFPLRPRSGGRGLRRVGASVACAYPKLGEVGLSCAHTLSQLRVSLRYAPTNSAQPSPSLREGEERKRRWVFLRNSFLSARVAGERVAKGWRKRSLRLPEAGRGGPFLRTHPLPAPSKSPLRSD